jgi:2-oxo-3-hexenedioate decarboxylase
VAIDREAVADRLIAAYDGVTTLAPITSALPNFSFADGYAVLAIIEARRRTQGWKSIGRKIGFTNRTIWPRYGVDQPNWAHMWTRTVRFAPDGSAALDAGRFVNPRIEPEVVFKLKAPVPLSNDPVAVLSAVEWMAPGFEIVQSHFPEWKFKLADCTAAFGLHGGLIVGAPVALTDANRSPIADMLPKFTVTLARGGAAVERGIGANVLDSPALALGYLARVLADLPQFPPLAAGEIITTGTITDAWPVKNGETWSSDYGELGLAGLTLTFAEAH